MLEKIRLSFIVMLYKSGNNENTVKFVEENPVGTIWLQVKSFIRRLNGVQTLKD